MSDRFPETAALGSADTELAQVYAWSEEQPAVDDGPDGVLTWRETLATPAGRLLIAAAAVLLVVIGCWWWAARRSTDDPQPPAAAGVPYVAPGTELTPPVPAAAPPPAPTAAPAPGPPVTRADPDKRFLAMMTEAGITITDARQAISGAREVCPFLAGGRTQRDAIEKTMQNNPSLPEPAATAFIKAATQVYCVDE
ncbi:DUF732 domain-containing protein [Mycobacterium intracellulare]|uniref:DUF732 domain-containing protein n=1 Tax=Mycobacterium intracellulare TaxID=1767 RepID=A0AAE4RHB6_MYCIT|nr:DUF732 domain-containing protein [Mycobacterium intracellulare]MDV6979679.1 DUF732 domain-containing protein [Mycobacterium intracellulare]MDV6985182.1 DUF732 domain-containing protein [Mycobacterium intracellulare]MDV7014198.1 DUF732 domain-containing protein [Mycobacterium intracellulare]MDV7030173.1 DUF732 domain-containing protein [Mycobacterium intracellulare]